MLSAYHFRKWVKTLVFIALGVLCDTFPMHANHKELLIINSYNENEPWVNDMIKPVVLEMSTKPNMSCEIYDLNNALMADTLDFRSVAGGIIDIYRDDPPEYVMMIGNLAFNMRHAIKDAWGDIPMLVVSTVRDFAPVDEYFTPTSKAFDINAHHTLTQERDSFNFTAIIIPEHYKQTVDLMVGLMPNMDTLVFMSDTVYVNRKLAHDLQNYLKEDYPEVKFSWLKASAANADKFHNYLVEPAPNTGLLLSTWLYAKHEYATWKSPTTSDLKLMMASRNPIFSMHEPYIPLGALGGVYPVVEAAKDRELEILRSMEEGKNMRDIPFYTCEDSYPCVNYRLLEKYNLSEDACPEGTVFYSKPSTFIEKYLWQTLVVVLLVLLVFLVMTFKNSKQRKEIEAYKRNSEFVNNMPIPYSTAKVRYDTSGDVITIAYSVKNEAFDKILAENVMPDSPFLLFPADFIAPKVRELLKDHKMQVFVYHFEKTDTYYEFILCLVNSRMNLKDKNEQYIDVFATDITDRHKMEMKLEKAMHTLDLTIDVAKLEPWQYSLKHDAIFYDYHKGDTDTGLILNEKDGSAVPLETFVEKVVHPDDRDKLRKMREDVHAGRAKDFLMLIRKIDPENPGAIYWVELRGRLTSLDGDRKNRVVIGSSKDITERVRIQEEMSEALDRANESDRMKSAFLASMSHEIRTPLNAIVGFSNVIAHTADEEERLEFCDIINKNNEQLLALINDVLDLAKIESNTVDINYTETDINSLIEHVEKSMAIKIPKGIKFMGIKGSNDCVAEIDENRVIQILTNLITNACKFTPSGNITFGYDITDHGMLYFYVRDTGVGISKENMQKVFDRFFKLNTFVPGTGLGLSICKNLVEKMGGEIGVESAGEGKGSMFWFTVPYVPSLGSGKHFEEETFYKRRMPQLYSKKGGKLKVLIAEDNESNYRLLAHLLKNHFELVRANNGGDAVREFVKTEPDVVLMDISMPGMDGYDALKEIRKHSATVPIIAVTSYVYAGDRPKILKFGFDEYVSKPITQKAIIDAIGRTIVR